MPGPLFVQLAGARTRYLYRQRVPGPTTCAMHIARAVGVMFAVRVPAAGRRGRRSHLVGRLGHGAGRRGHGVHVRAQAQAHKRTHVKYATYILNNDQHLLK